MMYDIFFVFYFRNMNGDVCKLWARRPPRMNLVINAGHVFNLDPMKIHISMNISVEFGLECKYCLEILYSLFIRTSCRHFCLQVSYCRR